MNAQTPTTNKKHAFQKQVSFADHIDVYTVEKLDKSIFHKLKYKRKDHKRFQMEGKDAMNKKKSRDWNSCCKRSLNGTQAPTIPRRRSSEDGSKTDVAVAKETYERKRSLKSNLKKIFALPRLEDTKYNDPSHSTIDMTESMSSILSDLGDMNVSCRFKADPFNHSPNPPKRYSSSEFSNL